MTQPSTYLLLYTPMIWLIWSQRYDYIDMIINRWPWLILYNYVESQLELYDIITEFKVVNIQIMTLDQIDMIDIVAPLNIMVRRPKVAP